MSDCAVVSRCCDLCMGALWSSGVPVCVFCIPSEKKPLLQEHISMNFSNTSMKAAICSDLLFVHKCSLLSIETSFKNAQNLFFFQFNFK